MVGGAERRGARPRAKLFPRRFGDIMHCARARGHAGRVAIYPGWYSGRAPHIHLKVHVGGGVVHTGQLFFDDVLSDAVYRSAHYAAHGHADTSDAADSIYRQAGGARAKLAVTRAAGGYVGAIRLAVRR
jgi:protocatechuate 3,4-dioxygenase beta subunit